MTGSLRREVALIRQEWLGRTLSTSPADHPAAEAAISSLYREAGFAPPRFHWADSPLSALSTLPPGVRSLPQQVDALPVAMALRRRILDTGHAVDSLVRPYGALVEARRSIRFPVESAAAAVLAPGVAAALDARRGLSGAWYQVMSGGWAAEVEGARRCFDPALPPDAVRFLDLWMSAASSAGWWWPHEHVCVVSERPVEIHTEPDGDGGRVRLHRADGPAVRYADGWAVHSWHGRTVPSWVIEDPSAGRISREDNVEIRRCAIERMGWGDYLDQAGLALIATAADPGNSGFELHLYNTETAGTRVLLAVNGSVERDGRRRRYGLTVPGHLTDPVAAAGWTYGLTRDQYATLTRRT
ncbi:hypothetical protein EDD29_4117 [Actinocorallia herbida]|uniref:DUF6745 domain-containing protein n=1 Tax=Actinocorallia herbida TaxID=58109 RepID=A0A3N1CZ18_9ACTN|nr:hypothetical protein [Actinocorallia herbida]ROO86544.1 hypothetical protein EDD29_4117 [Actinocorallia herbida]